VRRTLNASLFLVITLIGCGKRDPSSLADADVEPLKTLDAKSGGRLMLIPAGTFTMGEAGGRADETPHSVTLSSFYLDQVPVTQELYEKVMGVNPSKQKRPDLPVERTQWTDAVRFCNRCSELEGLTPSYDLNNWECNFEADGYRLPTEAEWEYACRAGGAAKYYFGDAEADLPRYAWFKQDSGGSTRAVGTKLPNRWGLLDMHGNVWQWCNDFYGETYYAESVRENPRGPRSGTMRVLRGGAWDSTADKCRAAYRFKEFPVYSDACFGADSYSFRRARNAEAVEQPKIASSNPTSKPAPAQTAAVSAVSVAKPEPKRESLRSEASGKVDLASLKGTIVFVSDRSGVLKIWTMRASGKELKQLTHDANADADPQFSPDGKQILYTTLRGGFPEVWRMDWDGSHPQFVTKGSQATWSPDGKSILLIQDNQTYVHELASRKQQRVTPANWERCGVPAWSPDGKHFAVASRHLGNIGIFILNREGKENHQLKAQEPCCTPRWSGDGKRILCQTVQGHIYQMDVDGKNWEQLTFGADVQHDARYSPDGTMIIFCRAPSPEGPWQICLKKLDSDDLDFAQLTKEGSNLLPDWHRD
jgi:formylglycine-generating enzyme required for sulfatase activity